MILILHILANGLGILIAERFIPGVIFGGNIWTLLFASAILGLINYFIKPILKIISFPLILISAGAFNFALSAMIIWFVVKLTPGFTTSGLIPFLWITFIIGTLNYAVSILAKK